MNTIQLHQRWIRKIKNIHGHKIDNKYDITAECDGKYTLWILCDTISGKCYRPIAKHLPSKSAAYRNLAEITKSNKYTNDVEKEQA